MFTLQGHGDCIRTVKFHHEHPWIVSASDDKTARIWNFQSRLCIAVLSGHTGPVMCAAFHPHRNFILTASLDKTLRVWVFGDHKDKTLNMLQQESSLDVQLRQVLNGHEAGVNWASYHPLLPLMVSGDVYGEVKLWHIDEFTLSPVPLSCRDHLNVTSVMFYPKRDLFVTTSTDRSIRFWDHSGKHLQKFSHKDDRFWMLAVHPEINLLAAGGDSGLIVFKIEREHPAFALSGDFLIYTKDRSLMQYGFLTRTSSELRAIEHLTHLNQSLRTLFYNSTQNAIFVNSDVNGGSYELYRRSTGGRTWSTVSRACVTFINSSQYALLTIGTNKRIENLNRRPQIVCTISLPDITFCLYYAGSGNLLCRCEGKLVLFDLQRELVIGELETPCVVGYVVWSNNMEKIALLSKYTIIIASKKLELLFSLNETRRVKSGAWDEENGIFIYSTPNHLKFWIPPNGDSAVIKTLEDTLYVTKVCGTTVFCLDRGGEIRPITIDRTEYMLKLSILNSHDLSLIDCSRVCGKATVGYLMRKGFPELALSFAEGDKFRFDLAIQSGNICAAFELAQKIDEKDHWCRLGAEAVRRGNIQIAELAYQKSETFERLSFLNLITGNLDKLSESTKIAELKNNVFGQFQNALYLGDVKERVKILENAGLSPLAYVTASVHGVSDISKKLSTDLRGKLPSLPKDKKMSLLIPPTPVVRGGNWPKKLE